MLPIFQSLFASLDKNLGPNPDPTTAARVAALKIAAETASVPPTNWVQIMAMMMTILAMFNITLPVPIPTP